MNAVRVIAALALAAVNADAAELGPGDFAYSMPLATQPGVAVHRVTVPLEVYRHTARRDLADLRVFNADAQVVPYAVQRAAAESQREQAPVRLPLFVLHGDAIRATQALRLSISADGASIAVQGGGAAGEQAPVSGFLLDARSVDSPISALLAEWPEPAQGFSAHLIIEASEDLARWRTVASAAPIADLRHGTDRLLQRRLEFPATSAKFWRLRWSSLPGPTVLTGALAELTRSTVETARHELSVSPAAAQAKPGEFEFDLGAHPPVDRVNLKLPQINTVADVELLVRDDKSEWRPLWTGTVYRLQARSGEVTNAFIDVPTTTHRTWLVRVRHEGGGVAGGSPQLVVRWLPHEVTFVARGDAPYELAYGSSTAEPAATQLGSMLARTGAGTAIPIATATAGAQRESGGISRLDPPRQSLPWRIIVLWSVLILAVGGLGAMALRLARQLQQPAR